MRPDTLRNAAATCVTAAVIAVAAAAIVTFAPGVLESWKVTVDVGGKRLEHRVPRLDGAP